MRRNQEENALIIARRLIYAFYVDKDIDTIISNLNTSDFIYNCANTNETVTGVGNMRDFLNQAVNNIEGYEIVNENYKFCTASDDSCLVSADVEIRAQKYQIPYSSVIKFLFYFKLVKDKLLVSYYQVQIPFKPVKNANSFFLPLDKTPVELHVDRQYHYEMLSNLIDNNSTAMKVIHYDKFLSYHYVNIQYLKLLNCSRVKDFVSENKSSIEHIYPADQRRYSDYVNTQFQNILHNIRPSENWQWHNSYYIVYRLCHRENFYVLEWGNLFTLNLSPMIMAIVLPLNDISIFQTITNTNNGGGGIPRLDDLSNNFGVRISKDFILYQIKRQVMLAGKIIDFTPTEFEVLLNFIDNINKPLTLEKIYAMIWNDSELKLTSNTLRMHISNIRRKLKISNGSLVHLDTIPNEGYKFWIDES